MSAVNERESLFTDADVDGAIRRLTEPQRLTLAAMVWQRSPQEMTDSEITERVQRLDNTHPARGSVVDRLDSLAQKGLVATTTDGPPRRRRATALGMAVYLRV